MFTRGLEGEIQSAVEFLHHCRPLAVSMTNALKYIKEKIMLETSSDNDDDVSPVPCAILTMFLSSNYFTEEAPADRQN